MGKRTLFNLPYSRAKCLLLVCLALNTASHLAEATCALIVVASTGRNEAPIFAVDSRGEFVAIADPADDKPVRVFALPPKETTLFDPPANAKFEIETPLGSRVTSMAFGRLGDHVLRFAVGYSDGDANVYDVLSAIDPRSPTERKQLYSLRRHRGPVSHLLFTPDSKLLLSVSQNRAHLWIQDVPCRTLSLKFTRAEAHEGNIIAADFSRDGYELVTAADDGSVRLWNLLEIFASPHHQRMVGKALEGNVEPITTGALGVHGSRYVAGTSQGTVILWDFDTKGYRLRDSSDSSVIGLDVSSVRNSALSTHADGTARVWDLSTRKIVGRIKMPEGLGIVRSFFMNDGQRILSMHRNGFLRLWNLAKPNPQTLQLQEDSETYTPVSAAFVGFSFLPGRKFVTSLDDGTVRFGHYSYPRRLGGPK